MAADVAIQLRPLGEREPLLAAETSRGNWAAPAASAVSWGGFWVTAITYTVMLFHNDSQATSMNPEGKYTKQLNAMKGFAIAGAAAVSGALVHTAVKAGVKAREVFHERGASEALKTFGKTVLDSTFSVFKEKGIIGNSLVPAVWPLYCLVKSFAGCSGGSS